MTLARYISRRFLWAVFQVALIIVGVTGLLSLVENIRVTEKFDASFGQAILLTLWQVPAVLSQAFPLILMLAALVCFLGLSRFDQFAESTGATRHIVSDRLKRLVDAGILEKSAYSDRPKRYEYVLTEKGQEFAPALIAFKDWGKKHLPVRRPSQA